MANLSLVRPSTNQPESWSVRDMTLPEPLPTYYGTAYPSVAPDLTRENFQASAVERELEQRRAEIRAGVSQPVTEPFDWDRFDAKFWRFLAVLAWVMGMTCAAAIGTGLRLWLRG